MWEKSRVIASAWERGRKIECVSQRETARACLLQEIYSTIHYALGAQAGHRANKQVCVQFCLQCIEECYVSVRHLRRAPSSCTLVKRGGKKNKTNRKDRDFYIILFHFISSLITVTVKHFRCTVYLSSHCHSCFRQTTSISFTNSAWKWGINGPTAKIAFSCTYVTDEQQHHALSL